MVRRVSTENICNQSSNSNSTNIKSNQIENMAGVPLDTETTSDVSTDGTVTSTATISTTTLETADKTITTSSVSNSVGNVAAIAVVAPTARIQQQQHIVHHNTVASGASSPVVLKSSIQTMKLHAQQQQQLHQKPQGTPIYVTATRAFPAPPLHQHLHTIGPPTQCQTGPQWPIVDPVFHFGPGFEHQHYCPTHSQGPQPHEHVVFFHVNPGVSVTFQISGNREIIRGKYANNYLFIFKNLLFG